MNYPDNLDPKTTERVLEQVLDLAVVQLPELRRDPRLREALGRALAPGRQPVIWRWLGDKNGRSYFEIGIAGVPLTRFATGERSVWWLWAAFNDQGRTDTLRARDFAAPDSKEPGASVRKALRKTAPKIVARHCAAVDTKIKALAPCIKVENGVVHFKPGPNAVRIITS